MKSVFYKKIKFLGSKFNLTTKVVEMLDHMKYIRNFVTYTFHRLSLSNRITLFFEFRPTFYSRTSNYLEPSTYSKSSLRRTISIHCRQFETRAFGMSNNNRLEGEKAYCSFVSNKKTRRRNLPSHW